MLSTIFPLLPSCRCRNCDILFAIVSSANAKHRSQMRTVSQKPRCRKCDKFLENAKVPHRKCAQKLRKCVAHPCCLWSQMRPLCLQKWTMTVRTSEPIPRKCEVTQPRPLSQMRAIPCNCEIYNSHQKQAMHQQSSNYPNSSVMHSKLTRAPRAPNQKSHKCNNIIWTSSRD